MLTFILAFQPVNQSSFSEFPKLRITNLDSLSIMLILTIVGNMIVINKYLIQLNKALVRGYIVMTSIDRNYCE